MRPLLLIFFPGALHFLLFYFVFGRFNDHVFANFLLSAFGEEFPSSLFGYLLGGFIVVIVSNIYYAGVSGYIETTISYSVMSSALRSRLDDIKYHYAVHIALYSCLCSIRIASYAMGFDVGLNLYMVLWGGAIGALIIILISGNQISGDQEYLDATTSYVRHGLETAHVKSLEIPVRLSIALEFILFLLRMNSGQVDSSGLEDFTSNLWDEFLNARPMGISVSIFIIYILIDALTMSTKVYLSHIGGERTTFEHPLFYLKRLELQARLGDFFRLMLLAMSAVVVRWYAPLFLFPLGAFLSFVYAGPILNIIDVFMEANKALYRLSAEASFYITMPLACLGMHFMIEQEISAKIALIYTASGITLAWVWQYFLSTLKYERR